MADERSWRTRRLGGVALIAVLSILALVGTGIRYVRTEAAAGPLPTPHRHHASGSIVGAATPELVPNETVVSLLLRTIHSQAGVQSNGAPTRLDAYFNRIEKLTRYQLSPADRRQIEVAATQFVSETRELRADAGYVVAERRDEMATKVWYRLDGVLSASGRRALHAYADGYFRGTIKILK